MVPREDDEVVAERPAEQFTGGVLRHHHVQLGAAPAVPGVGHQRLPVRDPQVLEAAAAEAHHGRRPGSEVAVDAHADPALEVGVQFEALHQRQRHRAVGQFDPPGGLVDRRRVGHPADPADEVPKPQQRHRRSHVALAPGHDAVVVQR